ncbi:hypothetical protein BU23DRAFT_517281 [Bimuria novae-zelandiae CBS 107.79]|uniref:Uncharacterized protein n=1 Tax=Bimuria novae-zelandiae CBS 107.79 TaxID=1447943 RepID=A0A6A5UQ72_9PLEO|nr:hypothetical protein BU23DRAFT_517281 [Bimuria novae-zelandiae CBS 107.79]
MTAAEVKIDTRHLRYTGDALSALKHSGVDEHLRPHDQYGEGQRSTDGPSIKDFDLPGRVWINSTHERRAPQPGKARHIGEYALTTKVAPWVMKAISTYQPSPEVLELIKPFAQEYHETVEQERATTSRLHDIDAIELTYQCTLEICAAILLAADKTDEPVELNPKLHASQAGGDDHFTPWGHLLTGLECDPPIIVQFPFYLMMCQSFTLEPIHLREDYVYTALTGVDWARGQGKFSRRFEAFEKKARESVPTLDDRRSGEDRSFWRLALGYLRAMNGTENARPYKTPRKAAIDHGFPPELTMLARSFDTIGSAYMARDGAAFLDDAGIDSILGSALPNDVMDLHTDIFTGETRNLLRLLYPSGMNIERSMQTTSTILSTMLCEIFRGHHRARFHNREDGRVSSTSPPYSFSRARHRRIFETLELYITKYPQFWEWTWAIYHRAKSQITAAGLAEPLVAGLKRAITHETLPDSEPNKFLHLWYDMVEDGSAQLSKEKPLGVSKDVAHVVRQIHDLWHTQLCKADKAPGWGRDFDYRSDMLLGEAGRILNERGEVTEDTYRFAIAYGRLSMSLPYVAYHTVDAIIMAYGAIPGDGAAAPGTP